MTKREQTELPNSWALASLFEIAKVNPKLDREEVSDDTDVSFVPMPAVSAETGAIDVSATRPFRDVKKGFTPFKEGDVLFAKITPCMENGKMAIVPKVENGVGFGSTEFHVLRPQPGIDARYLYYFVSSVRFRRDAERNMTGAVGQRRVPTNYFSEHLIPLPPSREQVRIVERIDELLSEVDSGIEAFAITQTKLKAYRYAILKYAFEGKLSVEWRNRQGSAQSTSQPLFANIMKQYDQSLAAGEARGRKKPELLQNDTVGELPAVPKGYLYTHLANLGDLGRGKSKHRPRNDRQLFDGAYPFIQTGDVKAANRIVRNYTQTYNERGLAQSKLWPSGTLCITIAANIAQTAFLGFDSCFPDSVVGFTPFKALVIPEYIELFIKSIQARIEAYAPATAQRNINLTTLEQLVVPLCSLEEQRFIVGELEARLSVLDKHESDIDVNLAKIEGLRQSILNRAFAGRLVHQDSNDEPAKLLLARLTKGNADNAARKQQQRRSEAA